MCFSPILDGVGANDSKQKITFFIPSKECILLKRDPRTRWEVHGRDPDVRARSEMRVRDLRCDGETRNPRHEILQLNSYTRTQSVFFFQSIFVSKEKLNLLVNTMIYLWRYQAQIYCSNSWDCTQTVCTSYNIFFSLTVIYNESRKAVSLMWCFCRYYVSIAGQIFKLWADTRLYVSDNDMTNSESWIKITLKVLSPLQPLKMIHKRRGLSIIRTQFAEPYTYIYVRISCESISFGTEVIIMSKLKVHSWLCIWILPGKKRLFLFIHNNGFTYEPTMYTRN